MALTRRHFIMGSAATVAGLGLYSLRPKHYVPAAPRPADPPTTPAKLVKYNDYSDIWREKWKWD
ncbi:MAG: twin-arginine translocation signal domain-containing protein, partial [Sterolibacterium sp.]|nr:twin-arginine translocation signal domain-containing protein [Sterolibacterium sp.]